MGINYNPKIVTDGLVLYIDPANPKSYPGAGNVLYDLCGNNYNATLTGQNPEPFIQNGTINLEYDNEVFDSDNIGDNYVYIANTDVAEIPAPLTYSIWFNMKTTGYYDQHLWIMGPVGTSATGSGLGFGIGSGSRLRKFYGIAYNGSGNQCQFGNLASAGEQIQLDTWYMATVTHDNSTVRGYLNGVLDSQVSCAGYTPYTATQFTIGLNRIYYYFGGQLSNIKIYNRALSVEEIKQNYNSLKARFGL